MAKEIRRDPTQTQREHGNIGLFKPHSLPHFYCSYGALQQAMVTGQNVSYPV